LSFTITPHFIALILNYLSAMNNKTSAHTKSEKDQVMNEDHTYLKFFYRAAVLIAFLCLLGSMSYLFVYLLQSPPANKIDPRTMTSFNAERRMTLISIAFFIAMSLAFLGFSLFLINAKGDLEGEGNIGDYKIKLTKVSPGMFAILCATVIIVTCANFRIDYKVETTEYGDGQQQKTGKDTTAKSGNSSLGDPGNDVDVRGAITDTGKAKKKKHR